MYWQVYLHKTVIAAEQLLVRIMKRGRELALTGEQLFTTPSLSHFLKKPISREAFLNEDHHLEAFAQLDDTDIMAVIKVWADNADPVLAKLCTDLVHRDLYKVDITNEPPEKHFIEELREKAISRYGITEHEATYFVFEDTIRNNAYRPGDGDIRILMKDGSIKDITGASDNSNLQALAKTVKKYIVCYKKDLIL